MLKDKGAWLYVLPLAVFLCLAVFLGYGLNLDPRHLPSVLLDKPIPAFTLPGLNRSQPLTTADFKGQVSLLNVWASWCAACRREHAVLLDIAAGKQVRIYGLNYKDSFAAAEQWLDQFGNPYTKVGVDYSGQTGINLGVYGTPETFVVDRQGIIRYRQVGPMTAEIWQQQIWPLVQQLQQLGKAQRVTKND